MPCGGLDFAPATNPTQEPDKWEANGGHSNRGETGECPNGGKSFLSGDYRELATIPVERTEMQIAFVQSALGFENGARVLDVACGIGRHTLPLRRRRLDPGRS